MHQWENTEKLQGVHRMQPYIVSDVYLNVLRSTRNLLTCTLQKMDKDNSATVVSLDNRQARYVGSVKKCKAKQNANFAKRLNKYRIKMCKTE